MKVTKSNYKEFILALFIIIIAYLIPPFNMILGILGFIMTLKMCITNRSLKEICEELLKSLLSMTIFFFEMYLIFN